MTRYLTLFYYQRHSVSCYCCVCISHLVSHGANRRKPELSEVLIFLPLSLPWAHSHLLLFDHSLSLLSACVFFFLQHSISSHVRPHLHLLSISNPPPPSPSASLTAFTVEDFPSPLLALSPQLNFPQDFFPSTSLSSNCLIVSFSLPCGMSQQSPLPIILLSKWGLPSALQSTQFSTSKSAVFLTLKPIPS